MPQRYLCNIKKQKLKERTLEKNILAFDHRDQNWVKKRRRYQGDRHHNWVIPQIGRRHGP